MSVFETIRSSSALALRGLRSAGKSRPVAMRIGFFPSLIVLAIACSDAGLPTAPELFSPSAAALNEGGEDAVAGPTVSTDKLDYAPGETVIITGSGFEPGEDVELQFVEHPAVHEPWGWTVKAGQDGSFVTDLFTVDESHVGVVFYLTATGASGLTASTIFTDGTITNGSLTVYPGGATTGGPPATGCSGSSGTTVTNGDPVCAVATFDLSGGGETKVQMRWKSPSGTIVRVHQRSQHYASNFAATGTGFSDAYTPTEDGTWTVYFCNTDNLSTSGNHSAGCPDLGATQRASATFTVGSSAPVHDAYTLEDADDGTGSLISAQNVASGSSVTAYLISRTAGGVFIANVAAEDWSLVSKTGGVVDGDLVAAVDMKSAEFTGALVGSAKIQAEKDSETPETGVLTVIAGTASKLAFTQQPSASSVVNTAFAQQPKVAVQDAAGNTITGDNTTAITLNIKSGTGTGGALLSCTTNPVTVASGIATFAGCKIDTAGEDYVLEATSGTLAAAESDEFDITAIATTLVYNSVFQVVVGQNLVMTATLSSNVSSCRSNKAIQFRIRHDPASTDNTTERVVNAVTNSSGVATTAVINTTGWNEGIYDVRVKFFADGACLTATDYASLAVVLPGNAATGGGFVTGGTGYNGRVNFGFNVRPILNSTPVAYKGQFLVVNTDKFRCKGQLTTYGVASEIGYATGTCDLQEWNATTEEWEVIPGGAGVAAQISFEDNGEGKKSTAADQFGFQAGVNAFGVQLQALRGGNITIDAGAATTGGTTASPGKKK